MSFIGSSTGYGFKAGHFLVDDELCVRQSMTIAADNAQAVTRTNGTKYVPAGAVIPANDATAIGVLYEDVDVTKGDALGSVVTEGTVYGDKLPTPIAEGAATAMTKIRVIAESPTITRPY